MDDDLFKKYKIFIYINKNEIVNNGIINYIYFLAIVLNIKIKST